jgi:DNA (cytosine-5)-methyltransferase 1
MLNDAKTRTFFEFFAGGGLARAGLSGWTCLFANDFDPRKAVAYRANYGAGELKVGDVAGLTLLHIPGHADLVWMSPPCQDLSLAGDRAGLDGSRSGAFRPAWRLIQWLIEDGRAPRIIALENVVGLLNSRGGADIVDIKTAFAAAGYVTATAVIDAARFVAQSRPRVFLIGVRAELGVNVTALVDKAIVALPMCNSRLIDILDPGSPCRSAEETAEVLALMAPLHLAKVEEMRRAGRWTARTYFRRRRPDGNGGKVQRAEIRDDEIAGALRTAAGGSSIQSLIAVNGPATRTRRLSPRECARLMGLPDSYRLPRNDVEAYDLLGDGVCVPVVRHLATHVFEPILQNAI